MKRSRAGFVFGVVWYMMCPEVKADPWIDDEAT